jgi:Fe2+ or Zn2+ uptake regulation protein
MSEGPRQGIPGLPPGVLPAVLAILGRPPAPIRRRRLLEELERQGHRVSLAGLNRVLQQCSESGLTVESDAGVRLKPAA